MLRQRLIALLLLTVVVLAACGGSDTDDGEIPTLAVIGAEETVAALTAAPTPTRTPAGPTLQPTWTPEPSVTPLPTDAADAATEAPSPTPETTLRGQGLIYYVYNGDSISVLDPATGFEQLIVTFGVDVPITDMTLAPDGSLLAFVAPGSGSAREVFVASTDGSYIQQVSCLGFAEMLAPAWSADSAALVFIGAQAPDQPRGLYLATVAGSGNCPADNGQRLLYQAEGRALVDAAWEPDSGRVFFSDLTLRAVDLATGDVSEPLTDTIGFGSDFALSFNPADPTQLVYIRPEQPVQPDVIAGTTFALTIGADLSERPNSVPVPTAPAVGYSWRPDGSGFVLAALDSLFIYEARRGSARLLLDGLSLVPEVAYRPDAQVIAYTDADANGVPQIFLWDVVLRQSTPLTTHTEGSIADLTWGRG